MTIVPEYSLLNGLSIACVVYKGSLRLLITAAHALCGFDKMNVCVGSDVWGIARNNPADTRIIGKIYNAEYDIDGDIALVALETDVIPYLYSDCWTKGISKTPGKPVTGMKVSKCGQRSGYSEGIITGVDRTITSTIGIQRQHMIECNLSTESGDSGSLITDSEMNPVGMITNSKYAPLENRWYTYAEDINRIITKFGLSMYQQQTYSVNIKSIPETAISILDNVIV